MTVWVGVLFATMRCTRPFTLSCKALNSLHRPSTPPTHSAVMSRNCFRTLHVANSLMAAKTSSMTLIQTSSTAWPTILPPLPVAEPWNPVDSTPVPISLPAIKTSRIWVLKGIQGVLSLSPSYPNMLLWP